MSTPRSPQPASVSLFTNAEFRLEFTPHSTDGFRTAAPPVARNLGFRDAWRMLESIPDAEKGYTTASTPGGEQRVGYLTEAGFYRALGQRQASRIADDATRAFVERFQSWVFGEVLPGLRRGDLVPAQRQPEVPATFAEALRLAADKAEEAERLAVENAVLKPAAHSWAELASAEGDYSVADAAKILDRDPAVRNAGGLGRKRLFDLLAELKWIHKGGDKRWHAYQRHVDLDRLAERARYFTDPDGVRQTATPQIRVTAKGIADLHRRLGGSEPVDYAAEDAPAGQLELTGGTA